jgi:hypothetical protein
LGDVKHPRGLSVVLVRFDRDKHAGALPALREHCATLGQAPMATVVVDNAMAGGEEPRADEGLPVIAGDNSAWEFSGFDAGITWLREQGKLYDVTLLVTDAFRAYGDSFLGWSDRGLLEFCRRRSAVAGWVDSFQEPLRLLGSGYQAWMRTSYLVLPTAPGSIGGSLSNRLPT